MSYWIEVVFNLPLEREFTYSCAGDVAIGMRVLTLLGSRQLVGIVVAVHEGCPRNLPYKIKSIERVLDEQPLFGEEYLSFAKEVARYNFCTLGEALFSMTPAGYSEKTLKDIAKIYQVGAGRAQEVHHPLNQQQSAACQRIMRSDEARQWFYLFGNTGSGKTLIFIHLIAQMVSCGLQSLYLLPEIALLTTVYGLLTERFGEDSVAMLHSGLSKNQRYYQWRRILRNEVKVVLGVRSAVFAPFQCLGLIIIDEEHDSSYKSQATPRYHARQVAMQLAKVDSGIKLVLGSATPSLEAYNAMRRGIFQRVNLSGQAAGGQRARFTLVDMRQEPSGTIFSKQLVDEVWRTKELGKQSAIFINRLGFGRFYVCASCGYEAFCPHCSVSLTYYRHKKEMRCHYCGYAQPELQACPSCQSLHGEYKAFGIELVEQEARRVFTGLSIVRVDSEVMRRGEQTGQILQSFAAGEGDILIGTQMVAKGFNFPDLRLVALVLADVGLSLPDFRATERLFSFLQQVAGRTGRYNDDGLVIAQTYAPNQMALRYTMQNDTEGFLQQELAIREQTGFPPFSRILRLVMRGSSEKTVEKLAIKQEQYWQDCFAQYNFEVEILGPSEAVLSKVAGKHRWQIIFRIPMQEYNKFLAIFKQHFPQMPTAANIYCEIDHDPIILL